MCILKNTTCVEFQSFRRMHTIGCDGALPGCNCISLLFDGPGKLLPV